MRSTKRPIKLAIGEAVLFHNGIGGKRHIDRTKPDDVAKYLFDKHHIFTVPIVQEEFQGIRVTPNVYTALYELDRFGDVMDQIARQGIPA